MPENLTSVTATSDNCDMHLSSGSRAFFGLALAIVSIVGGVGNSVLVRFVLKKSERRSLVNVLLSTMAASDTMISVLCAPFDLLAIVCNRWVFKQAMCFAHSFLLSFFVVLDVAVLVMLSLDRYFILVLKKDKLGNCRKTTVVATCAGFSFIVSCPALFDSAFMVFTNEHCRQAYDTPRSISVTYSLAYSCLWFLLPCGLLLLGYVRIIAVIRKAKRTVRPQYVQCRARGNTVRPVTVDIQFKQRTFSTILCLYGAAMVCRLPLAFSIFVKSLTSYAMCPIAQGVMLLTYINSAVNPVIYAAKIRDYWSILVGKLYQGKSKVMSYRRGPSGNREQPQSVYVIQSATFSDVAV